MSGTVAELQAETDRWLAVRFPARQRRIPKPPRGHTPPTPPVTSKDRRTATFAKAQDLYGKNRALLADHIVTGKPLLAKEVYPDINSVSNLYRDLFERNPDKDEAPILDQPTPPEGVYTPITEDDIEAARRGWYYNRASSQMPPPTPRGTLQCHPLPPVYADFLERFSHGDDPQGWGSDGSW